MKQWRHWFLGILGGMLLVGGSLFFLAACSSQANM